VIIISDGVLVADSTPAELKRRSPAGRLDDVFRQLTVTEDVSGLSRKEVA